MFLRNAAKRLLRPRKRTEIYIVSYPKTGRTWLRAMIGKGLCEMNNLPEDRVLDTAYLTAASGLPVTEFTHDGSGMRQLKTYHDLSPDKTPYADKKVLLLSRDVRDTLVSAYFQATKRLQIFDGPISEFVRSDLYGARKILTFYKHWHEASGIPREVLPVRYEEMHRDPNGVLASTLGFLGARNVDANVLQAATGYASFDNLKKVETENRLKTSRLAPRNPEDRDSFKVRSGKVGGHRDHFDDEDLAYIDGLMDELGTPLTHPLT